MYQLIFVIFLLVSSIFIPVQGQSKYESEMEKALTSMREAKTSDDFEKLAQHFDRIAKVEKENWLPLYYGMFIRAINAFGMEKDSAIKKVDELEGLFAQLETLNPNQSELLTLRALFRTVKVAKDPMTYGMSLSGAIIKDYEDALKANPNNPRAMYLMAQYNMGGAEFWGKDPKDYCPQIEKAKTLFPTEKPNNFEPNWGEEQVDEILNKTCKK